jgi:hypothetical protein
MSGLECTRERRIHVSVNALDATDQYSEAGRVQKVDRFQVHDHPMPAAVDQRPDQLAQGCARLEGKIPMRGDDRVIAQLPMR